MDSWDIIFAQTLRKYSVDKTLFLKVDVPLEYHTSVLNKQELFNTLRPLFKNHNKIIIWYNVDIDESSTDNEQLHRDLKQLASSTGCEFHFKTDKVQWECLASYAWCNQYIEQSHVVGRGDQCICFCSEEFTTDQRFLCTHNNVELVETHSIKFENYTDIKKYGNGVCLEIVSDHTKLPTRKTFVPMIYGIPFIHTDLEIDDVLTAQGFQTYIRFLNLNFPINVCTTQLEHIPSMLSVVNGLSTRLRPEKFDAIRKWNQNLIAYKFEQLACSMNIESQLLINALIHLDS